MSSRNISPTTSPSTLMNRMKQGMKLYFELAYKHRLIEQVKPSRFIGTPEQGMERGT